MRTKGMKAVCIAAGLSAALLAASGCTAAGQATGQADKAVDKAAQALSPLAVLKLVDQKTGSAKSVKMQGSMQLGTTMTMDMNGSLSWGDGLTGSLVGEVKGGKLQDSVTALGGSGKIQYRYLPDALYADMGMGDAALKQLKGKHWFMYRYSDLGKLLGASGDAMKDQLKHADPTASVESLIASGKVTKVGAETVDGVGTTHFKGSLSTADITTVNAEASGLSQTTIDGIKKQLTTAGVTGTDIDVWVNSANQLVEQKQVIHSTAATGDSVVTMHYSDYGVPVSVTAPPAADTVDFADLLNQAKKS